jgi:hypothetical protein
MKKLLFLYFIFIMFSFSYPQFTFNRSVSLALSDTIEVGRGDKSGYHPKYILLSLLLPGAGEWFMGNKSLAKLFLGTDIALWLGYWGTQNYIKVLENDYLTYAAIHAGVDTRNKNSQYWIDIGSQQDIFSFNENKRIERNLEAIYPEDKENFWQWDSKENRLFYNQYRFRQHDWKRRLNILIGGLIFNRLVSAVDVIRLIRKTQKSEQKQLSHLYFDYLTNRRTANTYRLNLTINW